LKKGEQQQQQHIFVVELVSEPIIHQPRGPNVTFFFFLNLLLLPTFYLFTHQLFSIIGALCGGGGVRGDGTKMILGIAKAKGKTQQRKSR
jgi:hypothetical protein